MAVDAPAGMLTLPGVTAAGLLLVKDSTAPPAGAGLVRVTLQFVWPPLDTVDGLQLIPATRMGAVMFSEAD